MLKVIPDYSSRLSSIQQNQKLGFDSRIVVELDSRMEVGVYFEMQEICVLFYELVIVIFNQFANGVPLSMEVNEGEERFLCLNESLHVLKG